MLRSATLYDWPFGVIRLRAHILIIELPYSAEALKPQLDALVAVLPRGSRRVMRFERLLGFLVPYTEIAGIQAVRWRKVLEAFKDWWIFGLNGELACKNNSHDAFMVWMDELRGTGTVAEREQPQDVSFSEGRQPGVEPSVHDLIERTFGKVILKPTPKE